MKKQYITGIVLVILLIGGGYFTLQKKQDGASKEIVNTRTAPAEEKPIGQTQPQSQETATSSIENETSTTKKKPEEKPIEKLQGKPVVQQPQERGELAPTPSQKAPKDMAEPDLLAALQDAGKKEQYAKFADYFAETYSRKFETKNDFKKAESEAYVRASDYLDKEKNAQKALDAANTVYNKVPFGWRFKYLRVRALEALGRKVFEGGDLTKAQEYAYTILQMEFRPEGANLLGDIFIKKIETALAKGDMKAAREAYEEIRDYELSADRVTQLNDLAKKLQ